MTAYASLDEFKRYLRLPGVYEGSINTEDDPSDDLVLNMNLEAASRAIDHACNRTFLATTEPSDVYVIPYYRDGYYYVDIPDLTDETGLQIFKNSTRDDPYDTEITDYTLLPRRSTGPWTQIRFDRSVTVYPGYDSVKVTGLFGWDTVPETIKNATLIQAARLFKRRDAPFGVAGSPEMGNELRLLNKIDPDVDVLIRAYRRVWGAV